MSSNPTNKLSVSVDGNQISFYSPNDPEDNVIITFHRTLRIPDDGKIYPLPPSLGNFPVKRVDDYIDRVPEKWKKTGGVFIPLYQREAMWMEFLNVSSEHPHALKVAVGKVNALSGEMWDEEMKDRKVQDYVVTPLQPWLDGINSGDGTIKQFIAMPLGQGYTVESQVTGEDKVGGAQIVCYNPNDQKRRKQFTPVRNTVPVFKPQPMPVPYHMPPVMAQTCGFSMSTPTSSSSSFAHPPPPQPSNDSFISADFLPQMESLSLDCYDKEELSYPTSSAPSQLFSSSASSVPQPCMKSAVKRSVASPIRKEQEHSEKKPQSSSNKAQELGLASGGKMKQQIIEDPYGAEFWDQSTKARVFIHIVNSEMFSQITGESVPPTPISAQTYASYNYPWYDHYTENVGTVGKSEILSGIKSVKEIDEQKYAWSQQDDSTVKITNVVTHKETFNSNDVRDGEW